MICYLIDRDFNFFEPVPSELLQVVVRLKCAHGFGNMSKSQKVPFQFRTFYNDFVHYCSKRSWQGFQKATQWF